MTQWPINWSPLLLFNTASGGKGKSSQRSPWLKRWMLWLDTWQFSKTWIPPQPHKPFYVHNLNETKKMQGPRGFTDHTTHQQKNTTSRHAEMLVPKLWSYCIPRTLWKKKYEQTEAHFVAWFFHGFDLSFQSFLPRITVIWTAFKNHRSILSGCFGVHKNGKVFVCSKPLPE